MADHIEEGRDELNWSIWRTYSEKRQKRKLKEMCEQVEDGEMPHYQYLWLHWDATSSESDKQAICTWTISAPEQAGDTGETK